MIRYFRHISVGREATLVYSCVTIQLIDCSAAALAVDNILNFETNANFRFEKLMTQVVGFWRCTFANLVVSVVNRSVGGFVQHLVHS